MLPIYEALIEDFDSGIYKISLVDAPAVESDFVYFNKQKEQVNFAIENEEQRMVTGVIMRADFPIYRVSEGIGEYYMKFSKETIKKMVEKMMSDKTFNNINLQHEDGSDVEGVNLVEIFIKDSEKGISPKGFEDIEEGSLFATYKIENDEIWNDIKAGTFKGFSIEALVDLKETKLKKQNREKNIFNKTMKLFNKILKSFIKFGSVETDKGELYWVGEADLQIGDELFYNTEDEEAVKVEDGDYVLEDGTIIVVKDGLVSEIKEKDKEKKDDNNANDGDGANAGADNGNTDGSKTKEKKEELKEEDDETEKEGDKRFDEMKKELEDLKTKYDELKKLVDEIAKAPAKDPIVEEFEKQAKKQNIIPQFGSKAKMIHN